MTLIEQKLATVEEEIRQLHSNIKEFTSYTGDQSDSVLLRVEADELLLQLRRYLRQFARFQYGVEFPQRRKR